MQDAQNTAISKEYRSVPISILVESATNPRKRFDEKNLEELAASMRAQGILAPLLVRELEESKYEVVAGARRLRAAKLAELETVPVRVVKLTDAESMEAQVVENLQREDIHPLEESLSFKSLLQLGEPIYTITSIAARAGKSEAYVHGRIKLADLIPPVTNYALQIESREEFVAQLTSNLPARPDYFRKDAEINRRGAPALADLAALRALTPPELKNMLDSGEVALDVRPGEEFAAEHVPGSINIALSGQFASWAGTVLGLASHPVLIAASDKQLEEARLRLARVGIEILDGYLKGGVEAWKQAGLAVASLNQMTAGELEAQLRTGGIQVLDVRREGEWDAGHISGANWWPLDNFRVSPPEIDRDVPVAVHCKGGYRSMIACSLLQRAGFRLVTNVIGGFDEWEHAKLPVVTPKPVEA